MIAAAVATALAIAAGAAAGFLAAAVSGPVRAGASVSPMTAAQVAGMFREYGDRGVGWTGGDSTVSVALPDGRIVWLFSDTFLGVV